MTSSGPGTSAAPPRELPAGSVTFVFTDIEGSTKLLKRLPAVAPDLFDQHSDIVRRAVAESGGHVISAEGDGFVFAFERVDAAVEASARIQRDVASHDWPSGGDVRVRIGLHTGLAVPRNDNYVAMAIHQAARVVNTAHGGQVVATRSTIESLQAGSDIEEVSLGRFRVRDFDEPVELVRLDVTGVPVNERPLRALPADSHNLVRLPTSFVGRSEVIERVGGLLGRGGIISLVGPGGTGKTRLAVEVGFESVTAWPDGVWFVELADVTNPDLVAHKVADVLGLGPAPHSDVRRDLVDWVSDRSVLLVIDNIETCVDACADLLPHLADAGAAVLATGREPMNVPAEIVWRLGALDVAAPHSSPDVLAASPGVALFVDRAASVRPDLDLAPHLGDVARICSHLDGLPLAIEIAAARVAVLTVPEILAGLADRFALVRSNERNRPQRQRTLRALLQGSYDLLDDAERAALRRLAVFGGTFDLSAASVVVADDDGLGGGEATAALRMDDIPELVWSLHDKSLVVLEQSADGTRYRLLESVREFAFGLLVDRGEADDVVRRAASLLLDRVGPWKPFDRRWLGEVAAEAANLRAVVERLSPADAQLAQAAACVVGQFHDATQQLAAGIAELTPWVARLTADTVVRPVLLATLADLHHRRGDAGEAERLLGMATELRDRVGTPPWAQVAIERTLGEALVRRGEFEEGAQLALDVLERDLLVSDRARMWNLLGIARLSAGDLDAAEDAFRRELAAYVELDLAAKIASANGNVAEVALRRGDDAAAASYQLACLEEALVIGQPVMLAFSALVAAHLSGRRGNWPMAMRLQSAALVGLEATGHRLYDSDLAGLERLVADAGRHLEPGQFAAEAAAGATLDSLQTAALTRRILAQVSEGAPGQIAGTPAEESNHRKDTP